MTRKRGTALAASSAKLHDDVAEKPSPESVRDAVVLMKVERIIQEAADLFFREGYTNTKVSDISDRLGMTKPFIYYHFHSKVDILIEICERGTRDALEAVERAIADQLTPTARYTAFVRAFADAVLEDYKFVLIYFREELNLPEQSATKINAMRRHINDLLLGILEEGNASGEFRVNDPKLSALIVAGMASYAFAWYRGKGRLKKDEIVDEIARSSLKLVT